MRRYCYFLSPLFLLLSVSYAWSQTLLTDAPPEEKLWAVMLKLIFPPLMGVAGPYLTGLITSNFAKVPAPVQYVITSILTVIMGALAGSIPAFPLGPESAATLALSAGNTGQFVANLSRGDMHPKTDSAKVEMAVMEKKEPGSSV